MHSISTNNNGGAPVVPSLSINTHSLLHCSPLLRNQLGRVPRLGGRGGGGPVPPRRVGGEGEEGVLVGDVLADVEERGEVGRAPLGLPPQGVELGAKGLGVRVVVDDDEGLVVPEEGVARLVHGLRVCVWGG